MTFHPQVAIIVLKLILHFVVASEIKPEGTAGKSVFIGSCAVGSALLVSVTVAVILTRKKNNKINNLLM